jgi:ribosomal protein S6
MKDTEKNIYEISFLLKSTEEAEAVTKHLAEVGAEILSENKLQEISLAYPINKINKAFFGYSIFNSLPSEIAKLNNSLGLDKKVLRFLIVTPPITKVQDRKQEPVMSAEKPKAAPVREADLSNDALEQKLEEILK